MTIETQIQEAMDKWKETKDGSEERAEAFRNYKVLLDNYHAINSKPYASEPIEPNDWIDKVRSLI